jgi:hypothetical protein
MPRGPAGNPLGGAVGILARIDNVYRPAARRIAMIAGLTSLL